MLEAKTLSISVARDWKALYEAVWRPIDFTKWATGLSQSTIEPAADGWCNATGATGKVRIKFTEHNDYGVMDHTIDIGTPDLVHVPMRVVPNGDGAEVLFTLYRQPGMSDVKYAEDARWVKEDLEGLKRLVEGSDS